MGGRTLSDPAVLVAIVTTVASLLIAIGGGVVGIAKWTAESRRATAEKAAREDAERDKAVAERDAAHQTALAAERAGLVSTLREALRDERDENDRLRERLREDPR